MGYLSREELHRTFGGNIYGFDYEEKVSMSAMATRIIADFRFDNACRKKQSATIGIDIQRAGS